MSTPVRCNRSPFRRAALAALVTLSVLVASCGQTSGQFLYFLGIGQSQKFKPKYTLSKGPILILIDDPEEKVDWPVANRMLFDALTQELLRNEATETTIPHASIQSLRQADPDFAKLSCAAVGRKLGADQVLWLEVQFFQAREELSDMDQSGVFAVSVKVINPNEQEKRSMVRLWPAGMDGYYVSSQLNAADVSKFRTRDIITQALAQRLAERVAKLFYEYKLEAKELRDGEV